MKTKNKKENVMPVVRNKFGVCVKQCCCSCVFKEETRLTSERYCTKRKKNMTSPSVSVCQYWQMRDQLRMAGLGYGQVKCREYLLFLRSVREDESLQEQLGLKVTPKSIEEIRREFEENYGSIYMEF